MTSRFAQQLDMANEAVAEERELVRTGDQMANPKELARLIKARDELFQKELAQRVKAANAVKGR